MQRSVPISNEKEFQEWLASTLENERQRLREASARRDLEGGKAVYPAVIGKEKDTTHEGEH